MLPETRVRTRDEMMKRVALFKDLIGNKGGLPDSHLTEAEKEILNVIGFQPPPSEGDDYEYIDAGPSDVISFPPSVISRFECIEPAEGEETALIVFVVAGDTPANEFSEDARNRMAEVPVPA